MMRYFKHKRGSFPFSQIKTLKITEFECFYANEIANWINSISKHRLMNQYSQNCSAAIASALCIKAAKCFILTFPVQIKVTKEFP